MGTRVFKERGNFKLVGDERDVMVSANRRMDVVLWCQDNDIKAELSVGSTQSAFSAINFGVNLWRVKDEKQRVAFVLKWG